MVKIFRLLVLFVSINQMFSQQEFEKNYLNDFKKYFTFQPIFHISADGDSLEVCIPFRFSLNCLTFEKIHQGEGLLAKFVLEFILRDLGGVIRKSVVYRDTISVTYKEKDFIEERFYQNFIFTKVPLMEYTLEANLYDREKTKIKSQTAELKLKQIGSASITTPIYATRVGNNSNTFALSLMNNALDFKKKDKVIIIPVFSPYDSYENLKFEINSLPNTSARMYWEQKVTFQPSSILISSSAFQVACDTNDIVIYFDQKTFVGSSSRLNFILLEFPEDSAFLQNYTLTITETRTKDTASFTFKINWRNPPASLNSLKYAIELMYYILPDEAYDKLLSLKKERQWKEFFELWKEYDTEPSTKFNEAMDEYYKRVDFAYSNFQTVYEIDGAKTERGKIFILYGRPSDVQRILSKDGEVVEIWTYYRLNKRFEFVSRFKKFELVKVSDL
ncbi:MAG: GWxTD domain-containing protein [Candidatus Kapaibacteriota bacterium]